MKLSDAFKPMTEKQIHAAVIEHWKVYGFPGTLVATIPNEYAFGQPGLTPGLPDLMVIRQGYLGFIELKREGGKLSQAQRDMNNMLLSAGIAVAVTYGRDEPIQVLETWKIVRPTITKGRR